MESAGDEPLAPQFADVTQVDEDDVLAAMQSERLLDADGFDLPFGFGYEFTVALDDVERHAFGSSKKGSDNAS